MLSIKKRSLMCSTCYSLQTVYHRGCVLRRSTRSCPCLINHVVFRRAAGLDGSDTCLPLGDAEGLTVGLSVGQTDLYTAGTSGVRVRVQ